MKKQKLVRKVSSKKTKSKYHKKSYTAKKPIRKRKEKEIVVPPVLEVEVEEPVVKRPVTRRGRKPSLSKMYFTNDTEDAIELYNKTECQKVKERIFEEKIKFPFDKLVENVFNTFKFSYFETGPLDVQKETVSHLVANIHKFEKSRGKAFSYFSIIAKHYLIFLNNSNYKRFNQSVEIGEDKDEHTVQLQTEDKHYKQKEITEFINLMVQYWELNIGKIFSKQRDLNIANAVIELFRNSDRIDAFNKKALYLYIREISNCRTQQITKVINKMKQYHSNITKSYVNTGTVSNSINFSKF